MRTLLHILFFFLVFTAAAQTARQDLIAMNKVYMAAQSYEMNVTLNLFKSDKDIKPFATYSGLAKKDKNNYLSSMMGRTTIVNETNMLVVDNGQRMILVRDLPPGQIFPGMGISEQINIDSLINSDKSEIRYLVNTATEKQILILNEESAYKEIRLTLDATTHYLKEMIFVMPDQQEGDAKPQAFVKVKVSYSNVKINTPMRVTVFAITPYLRKKGNEYYATDAYKTYQVINQNKVVTE